MYYLVPCMWRWEQEVKNFEHDRVFLIWICSRRPSFTLEKSTHARSHCFWRLHFRFAENSRLLSSVSSFSSSSSSLLFQLLQKAVAKYRCFFRIHVPCDQQCEGFNSRKCFYENISGKWQVRVLTHFPRDYFFFTDIQQSYGGERRGTNFTSRSLSLLKSSAATESAVCEDSLLLKNMPGMTKWSAGRAGRAEGKWGHHEK